MSTLFHTVNKKKDLLCQEQHLQLSGNVDRLLPRTVSICSATPLFYPIEQQQPISAKPLKLSDFPRIGGELQIFLFVFVFQKMLVSAVEADQIVPEEEKKRKKERQLLDHHFFFSKNQEKKFGAPFCEEDVRFCVLFSLDLASDHYILYK